MDFFLKVTAIILMTSVLSLVLTKQSADISLTLIVTVCCVVITAALSYIQPIWNFLLRLVEIGGIRSELLEILLKVVGIGMISQITELVCADSGNKSLGKSLQILTSALILCLSIPILDEMVSLIESLLRMI